MTTEAPTQTFKKYDTNVGWRESPIEVLAADFFGINNESNLFLNPAMYEERDGRMFDPVRKRLVAGSANGNTVEEDVISQLEEWFISSESGLAVWISPRNPYEEEQLTVYRIGYGFNPKTFETKKVLFLTSHQFKHEFKNPDEIRRFIFTEQDNEESVFEILNWLKNISEKSVQTSLEGVEERKEQARYYAELYKSGVSADDLSYQMTQTEFLGSNPFGCPPSSYFSTTTSFFGYSLSKEGWEWKPGMCRPNPDGCGQYKQRVGPCQICEDCQNEKYGG